MPKALALVVLMAIGGLLTESASAQSQWLDQPLTQWNKPGGSIPTPEASEPEPVTDPRCAATGRPAETPLDAHVEQAGWSLFSTYEGGWGVVLLSGLHGHDGMCRPWSYHGFVFVDGQFAGTLAPEPSAARTDGALVESHITGDGRVNARFVRYASDDPLCCPSRPSVLLEYRVERTPAGAVLIVERRTEVPR